jgi:Mysoin-binding motif of peroxisomes
MLLRLQTAVATRIDRADTHKFLEQFRYTIVASQLLSGHSVFAQSGIPAHSQSPTDKSETSQLPSHGAVASILVALGVAYFVSWLVSGGYTHMTKKRVATIVVFAAVFLLIAQIYSRRQWLRYRRGQALSEVTAFVSNSQDFDSATSAAMALIQEVELVSRGYRM